jgi:hypothetical protein
MSEINLPSGYVAADTSHQPLGIEVAFATATVADAYTAALRQAELK